MNLIKHGQLVDKTHIERIVELDNIIVLEHVLRYSLDLTLFQDVWQNAIDMNSCHIMKYLSHFNINWEMDIRYGTALGNLTCIKFLVEELNRTPKYSDVCAAVEYGHLDILQFFRIFSETNLTLRKLMFDHHIVEIAIENGRFECLKYIFEEDNNHWSPGVIITICTHLGRRGLIHPQIMGNILDCVRYLYDSSYYWPYFICPILFDNCTLVSCDTCITKDTCFILYRQLLTEHFGLFYEDIVKLLISFTCTFQECEYCRSIESWKNNKRYIRCNRCKTTYYCKEQCRLLNWKEIHKDTCGKFTY